MTNLNYYFNNMLVRKLCIIGAGLATLAIMLAPHKAAAVLDTGSNIPQVVMDAAGTYCVNGISKLQTVSQVTWLSVAGKPKEVEVTIANPGDPLSLDLNVLVYRCYGDKPTGIVATVYRLKSGYYSANGGARVDIPELKDHNITVASPPLPGSAYSYEPYSFPVNTSGFTATTDLAVTAYSKQVNWFSNDNVLGCVVPEGTDAITLDNLLLIENCPQTSASLNFRVYVTSRPSLVVTDTCTGLNLSTNGARIEVWGPNGQIKIINAQTGSVNLVGIVNPYTVGLDIYSYDSGPSSRPHHILRTWRKPLVCNEDFKINATASVDVDDTEKPKFVDFGSTVIRVTGTVPVNGISVTYKYYAIASGNKTTYADKTVTATIDGTGKTYPLADVNVSDLGLKAGDVICAVVSATPKTGKVDGAGTIELPKQTDVATDTDCEPIVNRPFVSFYGSDVFAGGNFNGYGSCTEAADIQAFTRDDFEGSGVQFAAFALGAITTDVDDPTVNFNSARIRSAFPKPSSGLKFSNTNTDKGNFNAAHCIPDYFSESKSLTAKPSANIDLATVTSGSYLYDGSAATVRLSGNIVGDNRINIFVKGNLRITSNITYNNANAQPAWNKIKEIPSLHVYVKGNLFIESDVSRIDGVFFAQPITAGGSDGVINTCVNPGTETSPTLAAIFSVPPTGCKNQLVINGAFVTQSVKFLRTSNSMRDATAVTEFRPYSSLGAEVFNFSPEAYMVAPEPPPNSPGSNSKYESFTGLPPLL